MSLPEIARFGDLLRGHRDRLGLTQEEVAEHLGLSRKTIGKRLDRIRDEVIALRGAVEDAG